MSTRVELERTGSIARLTLASPDGANRIDAGTIGQLRDACVALGEDQSIRAVIVSGGEGDNFSLGWAQELLESATRGEADGVPGDPFGCLAALRMPVMAEINGDAFSAGLELALACDMRVAVDTARFALPEAEFGLIPLAGGTQRLPRVVGRARALELVLLGRAIDAATAHAWGSVNAVAPVGSLRVATQRIAAAVAARGPVAEQFAKEAVHEGSELPLARALRYELDLTVLLQTTEDRAEGVRAFTEKRPPRFSGR